MRGLLFFIIFEGGDAGVEVSIHELLAAAREAVKSDYIKGESILCETRYHPDTHYICYLRRGIRYQYHILYQYQ